MGGERLRIVDAVAIGWDLFCQPPERADPTPFVARPATVPLDQMNADPKAILDPVLKAGALASAAINFREVDKAPEDTLNRVLWHAMKGSAAPYPAWATSGGDDEDDE